MWPRTQSTHFEAYADRGLICLISRKSFLDVLLCSWFDAQRFVQFCIRGSYAPLAMSRRNSVAMRQILHLRTEKRRIWAFFVCQHLAACTGDLKTWHKKHLAVSWENVNDFVKRIVWLVVRYFVFNISCFNQIWDDLCIVLYFN